MMFAAVHESGCGTFETCRMHRAMSEFDGKADVTRTPSNRRD